MWRAPNYPIDWELRALPGTRAETLVGSQGRWIGLAGQVRDPGDCEEPVESILPACESKDGEACVNIYSRAKIEGYICRRSSRLLHAAPACTEPTEPRGRLEGLPGISRVVLFLATTSLPTHVTYRCAHQSLGQVQQARGPSGWELHSLISTWSKQESSVSSAEKNNANICLGRPSRLY